MKATCRLTVPTLTRFNLRDLTTRCQPREYDLSALMWHGPPQNFVSCYLKSLGMF